MTERQMLTLMAKAVKEVLLYEADDTAHLWNCNLFSNSYGLHWCTCREEYGEAIDYARQVEDPNGHKHVGFEGEWFAPCALCAEIKAGNL